MRLRQSFQANAPLSLLFKPPTVAQMAIVIELLIIDRLELLDEHEARTLIQPGV